MITFVAVLEGSVVVNSVVSTLDTEAIVTIVSDVSVWSMVPVKSIIPRVSVWSSNSIVVDSELVAKSVSNNLVSV